jgi:cation transporter-like permease
MDRNPYEPPGSNLHLENASATPKVPYFKSWAIFFLITGVGGFIVGAVLGGLVGVAMGSSGVSPTIILVVTGFLGFVVSLPISFFTFKWVAERYLVAPLLARRAA